jgi:photosystem II stability/assembly factor-like uncharacterized protein
VTTVRAFLLLGLLGLPAPTLAYTFGDIPLTDVYSAAEFYANAYSNKCPDLTKEKLVAYILTIPWWEVTGSIDRTPSPMTLSRSPKDDGSKLYPDGQSVFGAPYHRVFWHPGAGAWQLDDHGVGKSLGLGRFDTFDSAMLVAAEIARRYCDDGDPSPLHVFGPWCGCGSDGTCGIGDRRRCDQTFRDLLPNIGVVQHDFSTTRLGGSESRLCGFLGQPYSFVCIYVKPTLPPAQGYTDNFIFPSYNGNPGHSSPLALPFYVYKRLPQPEDINPYEWRYWLAEDIGSSNDFAAYRQYEHDSRRDLQWLTNLRTSSQALCDITQYRGSCLAQFRSDGTTQIFAGGTTGESTVKFRGFVSDPGGGPVSLQIELHRFAEPNGGAFTGQVTQSSPLVSSNTVAEATANGLISGNYHWRSRTINSAGQPGPWRSFGGNSDDVTDFSVGGTCSSLNSSGAFTAASCGGQAPQVATNSANGVGPISAVLNASINPNGGNTSAFFEYGKSTGSLLSTVSQIIGSDTVFHSYSRSVSGLNCNTLYYFRGVATNNAGYTNGEFLTFQTASCNPSPPTCYTLSLSRSPTEGGSIPIASPPNSPGCPTGQYVFGTQIQVSVAPSSGWDVAGWSGTQNDEGISPANAVSMPSQNHTVVVFYSPSPPPPPLGHTLGIGFVGDGRGSVRSNPPGISCPDDCTETYAAGTVVTLSATPVNSTFAGWDGEDDCLDGVVTMDRSKNCNATFIANSPAWIDAWYPTSDVIWYVGTIGVVYWMSGGVTGNVAILLSTDGGNTFPTVLTGSTPNNGSGLVSIPNLLGTANRIRVQSVADPSVYSDTPGSFTIAENPQEWVVQRAGGKTLYGVYFLDENEGWVVGAGGTILHTTNGGTTWEQQISPATSYQYNAVYFADRNIGWAAGFGGDNGNGGVIVHTIDGGATWSVQYEESVSTSSRIWWLAGVDRNHLWAATGFGLLWSIDGGAHWQLRPMSPLWRIRFADVLKGWATTQSGEILKSGDGGATLETAYTPPNGGLVIDLGLAGSKVWGVGALANSKIVDTLDGVQWQEQASTTTNILRSSSFLDACTGWVVGGAGTILKTIDGGTNWIGSSLTSSFYDVFFTRGGGWTVGQDGTILKYIKPIPSGPLLTFANSQFDSTGGVGSIDVTVPAGCGWGAMSKDSDFITITSGATGVSNARVTYHVAPNSGAPRRGVLNRTGGGLVQCGRGPNHKVFWRDGRYKYVLDIDAIGLLVDRDNGCSLGYHFPRLGDR